jgi:hypothetical protein
LVLEHRQRAIARGAIRHSFFLQQLFALQTEMPVSRAAGNDQRLSLDRFAINGDREWALAQVDALHSSVLHASTKSLGLLLHPRHQLVTVDALREPWEIFNNAGGREQSARHEARKHERRKISSRGVKRGGETGTTGPDDHDLFHSARR